MVDQCQGDMSLCSKGHEQIVAVFPQIALGFLLQV